MLGTTWLSWTLLGPSMKEPALRAFSSVHRSSCVTMVRRPRREAARRLRREARATFWPIMMVMLEGSEGMRVTRGWMSWW